MQHDLNKIQALAADTLPEWAQWRCLIVEEYAWPGRYVWIALFKCETHYELNNEHGIMINTIVITWDEELQEYLIQAPLRQLSAARSINEKQLHGMKKGGKE